MKLTNEVDLAALFDIPVEKAADLRQKHKWPHVRLSRFDVRYTDEQVAQIVAAHSIGGDKSSSVATVTGLTKRSGGGAR